MSFDAFIIARFWSKVRVGSQSRCWLWRTGVDGKGYGQFRLKKSETYKSAHRVAYAIFTQIEYDRMEGLVIRHACDTPRCCNPYHLSSGTQEDNVRDRVARDRSAKGIGNGNHKLIEEEVLRIYVDPRSNGAIARDYNVHTDTIRMVKIGKTWRHVFTEAHRAHQPNTEDPAETCALPAP